MDGAAAVSALAPRQRLAVASVLLAMALVVLDAGMVNVALPALAGALGETPARAVTIVTAYQLALLIGLLPSAQVAERFGYRRTFVAGVALFGAASLLCAMTPTLGWLVAARILQGLGGAAIMALGIALLRAALGAERLGSAIAWNAMTVALCSAAGPAAGALILSVAGWSWLFAAAIPVAVLALAAAPALPPVAGTRGAIDARAIALHAAAAVFLVLAASLAAASPLAAAGAAAGALGCIARLFVRERGKAAPLVPFDLLAQRPFRVAAGASILFFTAQSVGLMALAFHLQLALGRNAAEAGLVLVFWPAAVAAAGPAANRLVGRFASGSVCAAGALILATGMGAAAAWPADNNVLPLTACAAVCGVGFGLFQVTNNRTLFLAAPAERSAAAGGLQGTARLAGQTAGALLVAAALSSAPSSDAPRLALAAAAVAALLAALVSREATRQTSSFSKQTLTGSST